MGEKEKDLSLEDLLVKNYITESDKELLEILQKNKEFVVLQSSDYFNWNDNSGKSESIVSLNKNANLMRLNEVLDIYQVDKSELRKVGNSYLVSSDLYIEDFSPKDSIPNLYFLGLKINHNNKVIDLSEYSLVSSERHIEYPNFLIGRENLGKSILVMLHDKKDDFITIVYRKTVNNSSFNSRLYLYKEGKLNNLDKFINGRIVDFMDVIDFWHMYNLNEKNVRVEMIKRTDSYLSMYS